MLSIVCQSIKHQTKLNRFELKRYQVKNSLFYEFDLWLCYTFSDYFLDAHISSVKLLTCPTKRQHGMVRLNSIYDKLISDCECDEEKKTITTTQTKTNAVKHFIRHGNYFQFWRFKHILCIIHWATTGIRFIK